MARDAGGIDVVPSAPEDELYEDYLPTQVISRFKRWMAVVDSRGRVAWQHTHQDDTHVLALVSRRTPAGYLAFLREREVPYLVVGEDRVDLDLALRRLGETFDTDSSSAPPAESSTGRSCGPGWWTRWTSRCCPSSWGQWGSGRF